MDQILQFLNSYEDGAEEKEIYKQFPGVKISEIKNVLDSLVETNKIELEIKNEKKYYRNSNGRSESYESLILKLLQNAGSQGMWIRDLKTKTNISQNLLMKLLKNMEATKQIKTMKSIKTNRKLYMLYDINPTDELTGGVWFSNSSLDKEFIRCITELICKYCTRKQDDFTIEKLTSLPTMDDLYDFVITGNVSDIEISFYDFNVLINTLCYSGRLDSYTFKGKKYFIRAKEDLYTH